RELHWLCPRRGTGPTRGIEPAAGRRRRAGASSREGRASGLHPGGRGSHAADRRVTGEEAGPGPTTPPAAERCPFCAVRIEADDDVGRERLVRSFTRPPFALERIEVLRDGRIAYRMKSPRRGRTHRMMTPMEFMARLAALVPPAHIPMVRDH